MTAASVELHGFYDDLDETEYHAHPTSLSVSGAKVLLKAPALYQWQRENKVYKSVWDFGTAAHSKVLGVGSPIVVHSFDPAEVKSPKATKAWKDQQAEVRKAGGVLLLPEENARVEAMAAKLTEHPMAMQLLRDGRPEVSAFAVDDRTGVLRRGRVDWLTDNIVSDYKSAACSDPERFRKTAWDLGYDMQYAWYFDLLRDLGHDVHGFAFIVQEKDPPYLVEVIELDEAFLQAGREKNREALERFRDCTASGIWPGYTPADGFTTISPPPWAIRRDSF